MALDSPLKLKASIPGKNIIEAAFSSVPAGWEATIRGLPDVADVKAVESVFRIWTDNGPRTTEALLAAVRAAGITLASISVQSTTLDDVFGHYTGHQLHDTLNESAGYSSAFMYEGKQ
jgi:hypothetical protein